MTEEPCINNIRVSAPVFRGAPETDLRQIISCLNSASFHFADDSAREWSRARACMIQAAAFANAHHLDAAAVRHLHAEASPIMPADDLLNWMLRLAREEVPA